MKFFEKVMIDESLNEGILTNSRMKSFVKKINQEFEGASATLIKKDKTVAVFSNSQSYLDGIIKWVEYNIDKKQIKKTKRDGPVVYFIFESLNEAPIASKGWTDKSIAKFGKTIGKDPTEHGFFDACVSRMQGKEGFDSEKAKGFCASIKDAAYGSPNWRGKDKSKKEIKAGVKKDRFKKQLKEK